MQYIQNLIMIIQGGDRLKRQIRKDLGKVGKQVFPREKEIKI
jgi:hypothetical protein